MAERLQADGAVHVPHLAIIETASVIRGWADSEQIEPLRARQALRDLARLPATRHPHDPYLDRVWALRANLTAYDAVYVAVAEMLGAPLLTCDRRLARAPVSGVAIELVDPSAL